MRRIVTPLVVAGACAIAAVPASAATKSVRVTDNAFGPKTARLTQGDTVIWRWAGDRRHNVVAASFRSPTRETGTYRHRFARRGTFRYRCTLHDGMTGRVVVR